MLTGSGTFFSSRDRLFPRRARPLAPAGDAEHDQHRAGPPLRRHQRGRGAALAARQLRPEPRSRTRSNYFFGLLSEAEIETIDRGLTAAVPRVPRRRARPAASTRSWSCAAASAARSRPGPGSINCTGFFMAERPSLRALRVGERERADDQHAVGDRAAVLVRGLLHDPHDVSPASSPTRRCTSSTCPSCCGSRRPAIALRRRHADDLQPQPHERRAAGPAVHAVRAGLRPPVAAPAPDRRDGRVRRPPQARPPAPPALARPPRDRASASAAARSRRLAG